MNEDFGSFIKNLRKENRLTQKELSIILGVSDKAVSKWEVGDSYPDISLLQPISDTFGISIDELIRCEVMSGKSEIRLNTKSLLVNIAFNTVLIIVVTVMILLTKLETDSASSVMFSITDQKQFLITSLIIVLFFLLFINIYNILQYSKIERRNKDEEVLDK